MKRKIFLLLFVIGAIIAFNTGCEKDPVEECVQEEFCDGEKEATACCTDGADCYYTYNGVEYPDTEEGLAALIAALDCTTTKSVSIDGDNADMIARLQALLEEARELSKR